MRANSISMILFRGLTLLILLSFINFSVICKGFPILQYMVCFRFTVLYWKCVIMSNVCGHFCNLRKRHVPGVGVHGCRGSIL